MVYVDDLAAKFNMSIEDVVSRINQFMDDKLLNGVFDDRGKFICITPDELQAGALIFVTLDTTLFTFDGRPLFKATQIFGEKSWVLLLFNFSICRKSGLKKESLNRSWTKFYQFSSRKVHQPTRARVGARVGELQQSFDFAGVGCHFSRSLRVPMAEINVIVEYLFLLW